MSKQVQGTAAPKFLSKEASLDEVKFVLGNGQKLSVRLEYFPLEIQRQLAIHGLSQKVGDSAASCAKDKAYGAAFSAMSDTVDALMGGKWNSGRESSGGDLAIAISNLKGLALEDVQAAVRQATEETRKGWMKNKAINAEVLRIRSERAAEVARDDEEDFEFEV